MKLLPFYWKYECVYARELGIMKLQQKLHLLLFPVLLKRVVDSVVRTLSILETSNVLRHDIWKTFIVH